MKTKNYYESLLAVKLGNDDEYFIENRKYNASNVSYCRQYN